MGTISQNFRQRLTETNLLDLEYKEFLISTPVYGQLGHSSKAVVYLANKCWDHLHQPEDNHKLKVK